jgi:phosphoglycolate phosphatase
MLRDLERRGLHWGIVTNKPGWLTDPLLIEVGLHTRARAVVSGDTLPQRKPHPAAAAARRRDHGHQARGMRVRRATPNATCRRAGRGMFALVAGFGYLGEDDRADQWFSHGWLDTPLDLLDWLDAPSTVARNAGNGQAS